MTAARTCINFKYNHKSQDGNWCRPFTKSQSNQHQWIGVFTSVSFADKVMPPTFKQFLLVLGSMGFLS
jgi:hypothetical protein